MDLVSNRTLFIMVCGQIVLAFVLLYFLPISEAKATAKDNFILTVTQGKIKGKPDLSYASKRQYFQYLGIPYAEPPVGDLRFARPVPAQGWGNLIRDGTREPQICPQPDRSALFDDKTDDPHVDDDRLSRLKSLPIIGSENCLNLNIYRPGIILRYRFTIPLRL